MTSASRITSLANAARSCAPVARVESRIRDLITLYRSNSEDMPAQVSTFLERLRPEEERIAAALGRPVRGLRMLDVGPGPRLSRQAYFAALGNDVLGVDQDVVPEGIDPRGYLEVVRTAGPQRLVKTLGRRALRLDAAFRRELARQLGVRRIPSLKVALDDVSQLSLPDASYDVVYSFSRLQRVREPGAALSEIARVLRPGGVAYVSAHLYTSDNGIHDPRIYADDRADIPLWSHLRPAHAHKVQPNTYINRLRLAEWKALYDERLPGAEHVLLQPGRANVERQMHEIRADGELLDYSDDELVTVDVVALWKKPGA
ncbi:MAG: methyltransferase domain-containing protein [Thermoleophilia bacterium]